MVKIRLARYGRKNVPFYRIVVCDSRIKRDGRYLESLGFYNPLTNSFKINYEQFTGWITKGAKCSETVSSLVKKHHANN